MGFANIVAQVVFIIIFTIMVASGVGIANHMAKTQQTLSTDIKTQIELATQTSFELDAQYQSSTLQIYITNTNTQTIDPKKIDIYVDGIKQNRTNATICLNKTSCGLLQTSDTELYTDAIQYIPFEQNTNDQSTYSNNLVGIAQYTTAKVYTGLLCSGPLSATTPVFNTTRSYVFWLRPTASTNTVTLLNQANATHGIQILQNQTGHIIIQTPTQNITTNKPLTYNTWNHVAILITPTNTQVYANTQLIANQLATQQPYSNSYAIDCQGILDEWTVYNTTLTINQIQRLYQKGAELKNPNMLDSQETALLKIPLSLASATHTIEVSYHTTKETIILTT
jgi:archaellum component FlaF (FlaF/FlaG flagellin family)